MTVEDKLWNGATPPAGNFDPTKIRHLPERVQAYLCHSIAEGTPLATAIRLGMSGEIKVKGWLPFTATQVLTYGAGFIWRAKAHMGVISMSSFDELVEGEGQMDWRLFGLIPFISVNGGDITRAAEGRMAVECMWIPGFLASSAVTWTEEGSKITAHFLLGGSAASVTLDLLPNGQPTSCLIMRWGSVDKEPFRYVPFGGTIEEEATFGGFTIPSKLSVGWNFGNEKYAEGEFFRCRVEGAEFR